LYRRVADSRLAHFRVVDHDAKGHFESTHIVSDVKTNHRSGTAASETSPGCSSGVVSVVCPTEHGP
ncbi:MAG: hypothetical protein U9R47_07690, partial [Actinomycetota bacterium]|nr:hypothetical protein [Actinomycetota bacterium]